MPSISLTEFIDFVLKVGTAKVTKVKAIKKQPPYSPATDHWRQLRNHVVDFHEGTAPGLSFAATGANEKKERLYKLAIVGYKKFLGKKSHDWFKPHKAKWSHLDLVVSINPELGLVIEGKKHLIKLYLKEEKLTKARINIVIGMMRQSFPAKAYEVAVLDVIRGQMYKGSENDISLKALLEGEAATFVAIWNGLEDI